MKTSYGRKTSIDLFVRLKDQYFWTLFPFFPWKDSNELSQLITFHSTAISNKSEIIYPVCFAKRQKVFVPVWQQFASFVQTVMITKWFMSCSDFSKFLRYVLDFKFDVIGTSKPQLTLTFLADNSFTWIRRCTRHLEENSWYYCNLCEDVITDLQSCF